MAVCSGALKFDLAKCTSGTGSNRCVLDVDVDLVYNYVDLDDTIMWMPV